MDNYSVISELTDVSDENLSARLEDMLDTVLNRFSADALKEKCRDAKVPGFSKAKKGELVQLVKQEFMKLVAAWKTFSRNDLKNMCKAYDVKNVANAKKEVMITQLLTHRATNLLLEDPPSAWSSLPECESIQSTPLVQSTPPVQSTLPVLEVPPLPPVLSLVEQLEKQKQEIEQRIQEEFKRKEEEERKRAKEEEERKKAEEKLEAKKKKQAIPKNVRMLVWGHYIGDDIIKHKCLCCKKINISNTNFEVGHVLSEKNGGTHEINNLRPICFACNHSMGTENMVDYVIKYGFYIG